MTSFTDLPVSVVSDVLCHWCNVVILAKVDSAFCSNQGNARTWLLKIMPKQYHTVPETIELTSNFMKWSFARMLILTTLRIDGRLLQFGQRKRIFKLSCIESLSFNLKTKFRLAMYKKGEVSIQKESVNLTENFVNECVVTQIFFVEDGPNEDEDFERNGLVTVINRCPKLRKLCINCTVALRDSHLPQVSPLILSQLTSLELQHDTSADLEETFDVLSVHCNNLNTLILSGEEMRRKGVMKLISSNPKLKYLTVDCPYINLDSISDALLQCGNNNVRVVKVKHCHSVSSAAYFVKKHKNTSLVNLDIDGVIHYSVDETVEGRKHINLRIVLDCIAADCYNMLFDALPIVNTVYIDGSKKRIIDLKTFLNKIGRRYSLSLTSLFLRDHSRKPIFTAAYLDPMLRSCVNISHVGLVTTNKLSCNYFMNLGGMFPQLRHIELVDMSKVTSATVIAILSSTTSNATKVTAQQCNHVDATEMHKAVYPHLCHMYGLYSVTSTNAILSSATNNVTKVTARLCRQVVASEVHEAVVKLNAKKNKTKIVEFVDESCGHRGIVKKKIM